MIQSGLSSSVLAIVIVVLILLAVKEFVESMNDKQDAANHREKIEEKVEEKVEELKEEIKEAKGERRDMLTWQNVTMGIIGVLVIVAIVLFVIAYNKSTQTSRLQAAKQAFGKLPGTAREYIYTPAKDKVYTPAKEYVVDKAGYVLGRARDGGEYVKKEWKKFRGDSNL